MDHLEKIYYVNTKYENINTEYEINKYQNIIDTYRDLNSDTLENLAKCIKLLIDEKNDLKRTIQDKQIQPSNLVLLKPVYKSEYKQETSEIDTYFKNKNLESVLCVGIPSLFNILNINPQELKFNDIEEKIITFIKLNNDLPTNPPEYIYNNLYKEIANLLGLKLTLYLKNNDIFIQKIYGNGTKNINIAKIENAYFLLK